MIRFTNEEQLLDAEFRRLIIKEIVYSEENRERKAQALRRHEVYRDMNKKWVMQALEKEGFKPETIEQMRNRATNISVCRKIVDKLAQIYVGGVERKVGEPIEQDGAKLPNSDQVSVDLLSDELDATSSAKKTDRYRQLFRNALWGCIPVKDTRESQGKPSPVYRLKLETRAPWEYDVIEDPNDRTKPAVIIFTEFPERIRFNRFNDSAQDGAEGRRRAVSLTQSFSDGYDSLLADQPEDKEQQEKLRRFIVWSGKYHFTMNIKGEIVADSSPQDLLNPIQRLPWLNISTDQDGSYWARGGDDIVEGSLLINKKLTDVNFISFVQGWGQLVVAARNVPKKLVGGPDNAFIFELQDPQENVQVFFASSNPPVEQWLETVRMTLAMLLSTNDLSVRNIAAKLDVTTAPSGVALMVENSEVVTNSKDVQELFRDREPELWEIIRLWHTLYAQNKWLVESQQNIAPFKDSNVKLKFLELKPPISEKERLEELKMRKDIGIATLVDLLRKDNPDLTEEEAKKKAEELLAEKKKMAAFVGDNSKKEMDNGGLKNGNRESQGGEEDEGDGPPARGEREEAEGAADQEG